MKDDIIFTTALEGPPTLSDMFEKENFKKWFVKKHKIDCLKTTIKIPAARINQLVLLNFTACS